MPDAAIASFILRFTQEGTSDTQLSDDAWRGVIRHVQSNEQVRFTQIEEALTFIAHYVDIAPASTVGDEGPKYS
jgi:hypothetical protein